MSRDSNNSNINDLTGRVSYFKDAGILIIDAKHSGAAYLPVATTFLNPDQQKEFVPLTCKGEDNIEFKVNSEIQGKYKLRLYDLMTKNEHIVLIIIPDNDIGRSYVKEKVDKSGLEFELY